MCLPFSTTYKSISVCWIRELRKIIDCRSQLHGQNLCKWSLEIWILEFLLKIVIHSKIWEPQTQIFFNLKWHYFRDCDILAASVGTVPSNIPGQYWAPLTTAFAPAQLINCASVIKIIIVKILWPGKATIFPSFMCKKKTFKFIHWKKLQIWQCIYTPGVHLVIFPGRVVSYASDPQLE